VPGQTNVTQTTCNVGTFPAGTLTQAQICASCLPTPIVSPNTCSVATAAGNAIVITTNQPQVYPNGYFSYPPFVTLVFQSDVTLSSGTNLAFCIPNGTSYGVGPLMTEGAGKATIQGALTLMLGPYYPVATTPASIVVVSSGAAVAGTFAAILPVQWPDNFTATDPCVTILVTPNYTTSRAAVNITQGPSGVPGCPTGLSAGAIAGIVIGAVVGAALIAIAVVLIVKNCFWDPNRKLFGGSVVAGASDVPQ